MGGHFRHILGTMGMSEWVDGGTSCALPVTPPDARQSHRVRDERERRGETQRGGRKDGGGGGGGGGLRKPRLRPRILRGSLSTAPRVGWRERNKAGRGSWGSSDRTMAQTRSSQPRTVSDRSAPPPQPSPARTRQSRSRSGSR